MSFGTRLILAVTILSGVGGWFAWKVLYAPAAVYVVAPRSTPVTLTVDGQPAAPTETLDTYRIFFVKKGPHTLELGGSEGAISYPLRVDDGFDEWVIPLHDAQCFALVDVSESHFGARDERPRVLRHYPSKAAFRIPPRTYLSQAMLPGSRKRRQRIHLLVDVPCDSAPADDARIADGLSR